MSAYHTPVLLEEAIEALNVRPGGMYIDATLGGGGHSEEILRRGGRLLAIDTDREAIEEAQKRFAGKSGYELVHGNFRDIAQIAAAHNINNVDGILFDLGVSSHQLDTPGRGFSYRFTGAPLDLRLNASEGDTAAQLVNRLSEDELYEIIARYGEEELARSIAHGLIRARSVSPLKTVDELKAAVGGPPARLSRVFQALRIAVNDELGSLKIALARAQELLVPGGRLVVISFHSLEDRIVKQFMRQSGWRLITTKPIVATDAEAIRNPRARSAKMRVAEKTYETIGKNIYTTTAGDSPSSGGSGNYRRK